MGLARVGHGRLFGKGGRKLTLASAHVRLLGGTACSEQGAAPSFRGPIKTSVGIGSDRCTPY
jgi:hypothetical protein